MLCSKTIVLLGRGLLGCGLLGCVLLGRGLLVPLVLLAALLAAASSGLPVAQARERRRPLKVACVGDSLTCGFGLRPRAQQAYPAALGRLLGPGYQVKNFGVNGCTALRLSNKPYWSQRALARAEAYSPDRVVILFGSNDSKRACWNPTAFRQDLTALVRRFQGLPSRPQVLLCTPTPVFRDRWGVRGQTLTDEVIPQIRTVAADRRVQVVDLHRLLRAEPRLFPDGIHPGPDGAGRMAGAVGQALTGR